MSLPVSSHLTYEIKIPSTQKVIKFRPFVVKEQKELMISAQSENINTMVDTLKSVIKSCVKSEFDINKLAVFDLEYIFTQIRAKSSGEVSDLVFGCDTESCMDNDKAKVKISIDLEDMKVDIPEDHSNKISVYDNVGVVMKYPTIEILKDLENIDTETEMMISVILASIDMIYDAENMYKSEDYSKEELIEFIDNMPTDGFRNIVKFFETMPKLTYPIKYTCPVCEKNHEQNIEGLVNFF